MIKQVPLQGVQQVRLVDPFEIDALYVTYIVRSW